MEKWDSATGLEEKVLDTRRRLLGDERVNTLLAMENLVVAYRDQGQWDQCRQT